MKQNGNDQRKGDYYVGLDVGTDSVGWAATDRDYNVLRFKGKSMWGVRLFDAAQDASARRTARTARRRLTRRKQRLTILEQLFAGEIVSKDPNFFVRMRESNLWPEDRTDSSYQYVLFNDPDYTDKDYLKQYPTVYHLRKELIESKEPHDARLVFLALHHILKSRGHFLYEGSENSDNGKTLNEAYSDFQDFLYGNDLSFKPEKEQDFKDILSADMTVTAKKKALLGAYGTIEADENDTLDIQTIIELLSGASVKLAKLYCDESLKNADITSISLKDDLDSKYDQLSDALNDERLDLIAAAKEVYDIARLQQVLGDNQYISGAKVRQFEKNKHDLSVLKNWVRNHKPDEYKAIFSEPKLKNYAAYSRYKTNESCTQDEFCSFLKSRVAEMANSFDPEEKRIYEEIAAKTFLPKLKGSDNGIIPYQLHLKELDVILKNAFEYLPFLKETDNDGISIAEKIRSTFTFRIPYFVGPLNPKAGHAWLERTSDPITPWNFEKIVDLEKSANNFMENLIGRCTYTKEPVLPLNSLLYSEFMVLNELNPLKINGNPVPAEIKNRIFEDLFVNSKRKVTKKTILNYLRSIGQATDTDELSGIDDVVKSNLKSLHDFRKILDKTGDRDQVEEIIKSMVVFSSDRRMLKRWLDKNTHGLSEDDKKYITRLNYTGWGRLSKEFLTDIRCVDENGEVRNIIGMLRETNLNLNQILYGEYGFMQECENYLKERGWYTDSIREQLDEMYIAPAVKRSIWQTLRIMDELVDIRKSAPEKIFIEMARDSSKDMKNTRTVSRKARLLELYKSCKGQERELYEKLEQETDQSLRRDKLYLYYTQFGKCMYSGEPIDLELALKDSTTYDIDHIYPKSRILDDSLDNRVLVKSALNRDKTNEYPIKDAIRGKMEPFWHLLKERKLISEEKYRRLVRNTPLTAEELSSFVARQITVTQQSTKALATVLHTLYPTAEIVYSKAGNVSRFRQKYDFIKVREINDLHHAKDAYLNIVVGNVFHTKFTKQFFKNIQSENYSLNRVFDFDTPGAWQHDGSSINTVRKYMGKNNPIVTFMPEIVKGAISDLQILSRGNGQLPIKKNLSVEKYGGYNKVKGSYFAVIEYQKGKKTLRAIVPVFIHDEALYKKNSREYFGKYGFSNAKAIVPCIPYYSLLELDGSKLIVTGRTESRLLFKHTYQLTIEDEKERYLKRMLKYIERYEGSKTEYHVTKYDGVSAEENIELYDWFFSKLETAVYSRLFEPLKKDLRDYREKFISLDIYTQCKLLKEILKAFKCDRQCPDLKLLCGKGSVGVLRTSSTISKMKTANLINQSVTGLFEYKVDLLK